MKPGDRVELICAPSNLHSPLLLRYRPGIGTRGTIGFVWNSSEVDVRFDGYREAVLMVRRDLRVLSALELLAECA